MSNIHVIRVPERKTKRTGGKQYLKMQQRKFTKLIMMDQRSPTISCSVF